MFPHGLLPAVIIVQGVVFAYAGIVNLRTPDFTAKDGGYVLGGLDQYGGSQYTLIANANALDNRLQVVLGKSFSGYDGPSKGVIADDINTAESYNFPTNPATVPKNIDVYSKPPNITRTRVGEDLHCGVSPQDTRRFSISDRFRPRGAAGIALSRGRA